MPGILVVAAIVALAAAVWWWASRWRRERLGAMSILRNAASYCPPRVEIQLLTVDRIAPNTRERPERLGKDLEDRGLVLLAIYENVTLGKMLAELTPEWCFVNPSGTPMMAIVFRHPKLEWATCSLTTRLSDGRRIVTSNAESTASTPRRAEVEAQVLTRGTTVAELLRAHRAAVEARLTKEPTLTADAPSTVEALLADLHEQQQLTHAFRRSIGWVSEAQLIGNSRGKDALARRIYRHTRRLLAKGFDPLAAKAEVSAVNVVRIANDDPRMSDAIQQARASVDRFVDRLRAPQAGDEAFAIKAAIRDGEAVEHLWLSRVRLEGDTFVGQIANTPHDVHNVREGQEWRVAKAEISDWTFTASGKFYGNFTLRATRGALPPDMREAVEQRLANLPQAVA